MRFVSRPIVSLLLLSVCHLAAAATISTPPTTQPSPPPPLKGMDISGVVHLLADDPDVKATALVFLSTQCPISNKYVPELNRLAGAQGSNETRFFAVISDPSVTRAAAAKYVAEYQITFPVLFDASGELAHRLDPKMTPEAFVLDRHGD